MLNPEGAVGSLTVTSAREAVSPHGAPCVTLTYTVDAGAKANGGAGPGPAVRFDTAVNVGGWSVWQGSGASSRKPWSTSPTSGAIDYLLKKTLLRNHTKEGKVGS